MKMTKKIVYFEGLSDESKEKAREWYKEGQEYPMLKMDIEEFIAEEILSAGYSIEKPIEVLYSLSYCQGDGVSFETTLEKNGGRDFVTQKGNYVHEMTMSMECESLEDFSSVDCVEELEEMREIARKAEKMGYKEIEYQDSAEQVDESIITNEYTFTLEGERMNPDTK